MGGPRPCENRIDTLIDVLFKLPLRDEVSMIRYQQTGKGTAQ